LFLFIAEINTTNKKQKQLLFQKLAQFLFEAHKNADKEEVTK